MCSMERGPQARFVNPSLIERRQPDSEMVAVEVRSVRWSLCNYSMATDHSIELLYDQACLQNARWECSARPYNLLNDVTAYAMLRRKVTDVQSRFSDAPIENMMFMFELLRIMTGKESGLGVCKFHYQCHNWTALLQRLIRCSFFPLQINPKNMYIWYVK